MNEKRRALGRGLGALIPTSPGAARPVDVFFHPQGLREEPPLNGHAAEHEHNGADEDGARLDGVQQETEHHPTESGDGQAGATLEDLEHDEHGEAGGQEDRSDSNGYAVADDTHKGSADPGEVDTVARYGEPDAPEADDGQPADTAEEPAHGPEEAALDGLRPVPGATFAELPIDAITPNPRQPRTVFDADELAELAASIREIGVLQPVVVRPVRDAPAADDGSDEHRTLPGPRYELVMGERRLRASQQAGLATIPAIVKDTQDDDLLRDALLENLHRSQLNPLEEAAAYQQLLDDFGCSQEELATRIGRSRPQISNTLRLLRLPPLVARRVAAGVLSAGHARALLSLDDGAAMERLAQRVVAEGLSVRSVEEIVAVGSDISPRARRPRAGGRHPQLDDLAARLSDRFDTRVSIALGQRKGRLTVEFASVEDLHRILRLMEAEPTA